MPFKFLLAQPILLTKSINPVEVCFLKSGKRLGVFLSQLNNHQMLRKLD